MLDDETAVESTVLWAFDKLAKEPTGQKMLDITSQYKPDVEYVGTNILPMSSF